MADQVGKMSVLLGIDGSQFAAGLQKAGSQAKDWAGQLESTFRSTLTGGGLLDVAGRLREGVGALAGVSGPIGIAAAAVGELAARHVLGRQGAAVAAMAGRLRPGELERIQEEGLASGAIATNEQTDAVRRLNRQLRETRQRIEDVQRARENDNA